MIKRAFKAILARTGYSIAKTPLPEPERIRKLSIGGAPIFTDNTALLDSYQYYTETNALLGRIASLLCSRHSGIAAIDIGANCGDSAAILRAGAPDMPILCIEGDPQTAGVLEKNVAQLKDIYIHRAYLGEHSTTISAKIDKAGWNATLTKNNDPQATRIDLVRLDELAMPWPEHRRIALIKSDTEGYDVGILHGAKELLLRDRPVLAVEYNRDAMQQTGEDGFRLFDYLRSVNYGTFLAYDAFGRFLLAGDIADGQLLQDLHAYADGICGRVYYYDFIFFPAEQAADARCFIEAEREHRLSPGPSPVRVDFVEVNSP